VSDSTPVLEARDLSVHFSQSKSITEMMMTPFRDEEMVRAVDGVSMELAENEVTAVIGESGCGKTTLVKALMGLQDPTGGEILYQGRALSSFDRSDWKDFRSNVQIIFQDPFNSLDPKMTVEETLREPLYIHGFEDRDRRVRETLETVELSPPEKFLDQLPRQLSGGEKQRVAIARALILEPDILLADEPVSMLDVSTQAAILNLLSELTDEFGVSMVYISHDLSTVGHICDRVNVMYLGRIVESAPTIDLVNDPKHPYTKALLNAIPIPDPHTDRSRTSMEGSAPDPIGLGEGCRFRDRCPERMDVCEKTPEFVEVGEEQYTACHLHYDHEARTDHETAEDSVAQSPEVSETR
jgi:peptide/nickel transport system ATP-binding protein